MVEGLSQIKDKRTEPLLEKLKEQGWRIEAKKKGWMCYPPDKSKPGVPIHKTPSDARWYENCLKYLRRGGFQERAAANLAETKFPRLATARLAHPLFPHQPSTARAAGWRAPMEASPGARHAMHRIGET